jgi:hypothetical protein
VLTESQRWFFEDLYNETNTLGWQNGSKLGATARFKLVIGLLGEVVKFASGHVGFQSLIPRIRYKILKPTRKRCQVRRR